MNIRILLIEDDHNIVRSLQLLFASHSITCNATASASYGLELMKLDSGRYDLLILDLMLPDGRGLDLLVQLKAAGIRVPILILSGLNSTKDKIQGLGLGADDYVTKPFHRGELIARIHAIVRRSRGHAAAVLRLGELCIDLDTRIVYVSGNRVQQLTDSEYAVLEMLAMRIGSAVSKQEIMDQLYEGTDEADRPAPKIVDVYVCKARHKLYQASGGKNYIGTVWGRGYMLREASPELTEECLPASVESELKPEPALAELSTV